MGRPQRFAGRKLALRRAGRVLLTLAIGLGLVFSLLPLLGMVGQPWPGFFYSPFYTNNLFSEAQTPAHRAGLRPEDRVIQVAAQPSQVQRIDQLNPETRLAAAQNRPLRLVYELGRTLAELPVQIEPLGWWRLLEKAGPFFVSAFTLAALSWFGPKQRRVLAGCAALALLAAPDYFLNSGHGLESGFAPALTDWPLYTAKWSTFVYAPFWKISLFVAALQLVQCPKSNVQSAGMVQSSRFKVREGKPMSSLKHWRLEIELWTILQLWTVLFVVDLVSFGYEASRTAIYNNPDYMVWHGRAAFWPEWVGLGLLSLIAVIMRPGGRGWLSFGGLLFFVVGFVVPTTFDLELFGPGPQWYSFGLVLAIAWLPSKK